MYSSPTLSNSSSNGKGSSILEPKTKLIEGEAGKSCLI
jgi:hypothetical protein